VTDQPYYRLQFPEGFLVHEKDHTIFSFTNNELEASWFTKVAAAKIAKRVMEPAYGRREWPN
jgi:hypothetical protein